MYYIYCLQSPFSTLFPGVIIMARVDDNILDIIGQMLALSELITLCLIMYVMFSLMVSMPSSYFNVSNRFFKSSWKSMSFEPICVVFLHSILLESLMRIAILWALDLFDDCYVCYDVCLDVVNFSL